MAVLVGVIDPRPDLRPFIGLQAVIVDRCYRGLVLRGHEPIPLAPVGAVESPNPHGLAAVGCATTYPYAAEIGGFDRDVGIRSVVRVVGGPEVAAVGIGTGVVELVAHGGIVRSEEHTSELQSLRHL